ncbi:MAG TPA: hypothetical protein DEF43_00555 [Chloroflexus aurantiacus]|jgi:hypothetical protein|uniref:Uncharacterized protein n=1 Tax=Chloroflexus aurantiacus (strain ATCC 29366 / DSM 635 / J-10-fl) TaxID=324602 RepID=A9WAI6_CHLAA|nr:MULTISPECIES: hypothetical protein [Chloroflexus]ABY36776.1 hypothetical protein Caur_3592 [Chloroflexus aurantiacus J-10-fl]RMG52973.1 MAG: hypothetical protein D6716_02160 [Chloroflexota bacterium]HBW65666.1 hypothetical protein [Chloroflexus aurantiacus]
MAHKTVIPFQNALVVLMDSISYLNEHDQGAFVVSGSHGGISSARYALAVSLRGVVFNDAGIGKDQAGIAGLELLDTAGVPAIAVAHTSARIGDAADTWANGLVSAFNQAAAARGVRMHLSVQEAATCILSDNVR